MYDITVIGSGPAGLCAAIYAARANLKTVVIEGPNPGGQLVKTSFVENYPGFSNPILGPNLMEEFLQQAINCNAQIKADSVLEFNKENNFFNITLTKEVITTKTIIICTGSTPKMLQIERNLIGKGISTCATCDGSFFKNKDVAVIGGGNSAIEEALYLSKIVNKVYLIHRRTSFRAEKIMLERMKKQENIIQLTPYCVLEFIGDNLLVGMKIENQETKEEKILNINGAFIAIGHVPNTQFIKNNLKLTESNYIKNGPITEIDGIFVAGDVFDYKYRQAITAAGYGCMAALEAIKYLELY